MSGLNFLAEGTAKMNPATIVIMVVVLIALVVVVFVLPMINKRKQGKEYKNLTEQIKNGDTVKTIGGMIGKVVSVKHNNGAPVEFVVETGEGDNKTTMTFDINALYQVIDEQTHQPIPVQTVVKPEAPAVTAEAKTEEVFEEAPATETSAQTEEPVAEQTEGDAQAQPAAEEKPAPKKKAKKN